MGRSIPREEWKVLTLDALAAQAVFTARAFERAVHDAGPWSMVWGPFEVPAERVVTHDTVDFVGTFPEHCFLVTPEPVITLRCRGEDVLSRSIEFPGDQGFTVRWGLSGASAMAA